MDHDERPTPSRNILLELLRRLRFDRPGKNRPSTKDDDDERLRAQVAVIRRAFHAAGMKVAGAGVEGDDRPSDDADVHYLYEPENALLDAKEFPRLEKHLGNDERYDGTLERIAEPTPGLLLVKLPSRRDSADRVLATITELEQDGILPPGAITPDHVVYVTAKSAMCPATEPEEPRSRTPWPVRRRLRTKVRAEAKIRVAVVDTGLWHGAIGSAESPWLEADDVFADSEDLEHVNPVKLHEYAGHGTFVAGVIACMAPETHIDVEGALTHGGAVLESRICQQIQDALDENRPHIVSISAGTHTRGGHPMLSFVLLARNNKFDERDDVLIVAAAGNDSSNERFWPAAFAEHFPWVVSVGSVDPDKKVSDFSNYGKDWVTVYARGRNLVNAFPKGTYKCYEPPNVGKVRKFDGLAQWSGTSFSTPIVTGLIAAEMRDNGLSARAAWDVVRNTAIDHHDTRIGEDIKIVGPLT